MEYENDFDSFDTMDGYDDHLAEFDNSDEAVDSYLDVENEEPDPDPFAEADFQAEIDRLHREEFPWD